jgi:iron(III) transport system substrate-binding protein
MHRATVSGLAAVLLLVACGGGQSDSDGPLVVYSGRSEELVAPLLEGFTTQTGVELDVRYAGSSELAATLLAEGEATGADVFFAQDPASLGAVGPLFTPLPEAVLDRVEARFRDRDGLWVGTSGRARVVVYNTEAGVDLPSTIDDMTDPQWAGQLGIAPTNASFLAFISAMILERGEDATRAWLEAIADNDPVDFEGNLPIVEATDSGELEGGLVNHYYLLQLRAEGLGQTAENHFLSAGDAGSLVMPAGVGVLAGSDQPTSAEQFVEYLLSEEAQTYFATDTFEYPLIDGVDEPAGTRPLSEINAPDIDVSDLAGVLDDATRLVAEAGLV